MDLKKKSKAFSRLALKEKIFLLKKTKALATLGKELEKVGSLQITLSKLVSDENLNDSHTTASQLKSNKFLLNKGERGYIIPLPISETGISDGIRRIINNKKEAMSKAKVAKEFLNQQHNFNMNADIYHENINEMFN